MVSSSFQVTLLLTSLWLLLIASTHRHVFTGIAQYFNLTWCIWLRCCLDGKQDDIELVWPSWVLSVPVVERIRKAQGHKKVPRPGARNGGVGRLVRED